MKIKKVLNSFFGTSPVSENKLSYALLNLAILSVAIMAVFTWGMIR